jgi:hypothetical protein
VGKGAGAELQKFSFIPDKDGNTTVTLENRQFLTKLT